MEAAISGRTKGEIFHDKVPLDADKRRIRELERELKEAKEDVLLLKKGRCLVYTRQSQLKIVRNLSKAEPRVSIERLCRLFKIPVSSYYYRPVEKTDESAIIEKLNQLHTEHFESYGRRRMTIALQNAGFKVGVFKTARIMREVGIVAKHPKKPHYYAAGKEKPDTANLLNWEFAQPKSGTHWVGDITYSVLGVYF